VTAPRLSLSLDGWAIAVVAVFALLVWFRFANLTGIPGEMVSDHAEKLLDVVDILNGQNSIFFPRNTGREALQFYLAAATAGALIGSFSGILKRALDVDELISSFLVSAIVILFIDYLITGPLQDGSSNFQTTLAIAPAFRFPRILPPSSLSTGIFMGLAVSLLAKLAFDRTRFGYELRVYGQGGEFARYCGIDTGLYTLLPMGLSGALHGLAGAAMIMGSYYKAMRGFSAGVGWSAISVALIARNNPLAVIPSAIFLAYLEAGAKGVMIGSNVSSEIVSVVQAVIFFLITAKFAIRPKPRKLKGASL